MDWFSQASCKGYNVDLWYPPLDAPDPNLYYRISKAICFTCPVWENCQDEARKKEERWGCWAGLTPQDRIHPHRVPHGTRERYRLGCNCDRCFDAEAEPLNNVNMEGIPKNGQQYDIAELSDFLSA